MVKSDIISATKANRLYWLGRYECRVYATLHQLNKCFDEMIDGEPDDYTAFWEKLDASGIYKTNDEFTYGMLYDENNPGSVLSAQKCAMDNAILLREDIMSETLSYLEMSVALLRKGKQEATVNISHLQPIIDWSLAFWGSAEQRLQNHKALNIMMIGRNVENLDMLLRFGYPYRRIALAYDSLKRYCRDMTGSLDDNISSQLDALITADKFDLSDEDYKTRLLKFVNQLVRV